MLPVAQRVYRQQDKGTIVPKIRRPRDAPTSGALVIPGEGNDVTQHRAFDGTLSPSSPKGYPAALAFRDRAAAIDAVIGDRSVVYAIRLADGIVKIGCTANFRSRRRQFGSGTRFLAFRFGDVEDEQEIHGRLVAHRARGREYYHPAPEVLAVVNQMRDEFNLPHIVA